MNRALQWRRAADWALRRATVAAIAAGAAACGGQNGEAPPAGGESAQDAGGVAQDGAAQGQDGASQAGGGQAGGAQGDAAQGGATSSAQTTDVAIATFSAAGPPEEGADAQGRLPAEGDLSIYIPATTLFPGTARLDPSVENPYAGDEQAIAAGERHFAAFNCAGCHAPLGGGGMGPPLSDEEWIYGEEPAQVYLSIMHGRPEGMPAWSSMLPRKTAWELVSYVETLSEIEDYAAEKGFGQSGSQYQDPGGGQGAGETGGQGQAGAPTGTTGEGGAGQSGSSGNGAQQTQ